MRSWSGRHGRRFGFRGQTEGLDSGRLEAGERDCLGIVVGVRAVGLSTKEGTFVMTYESITPVRLGKNGLI